MKFQKFQQTIINKIKTKIREKNGYIGLNFLDNEIIPDSTEIELEKINMNMIDQKYPLPQRIMIYLASLVVDEEYESSSWCLALSKEEFKTFFMFETPLITAVTQLLIENSHYIFQTDINLDTGQPVKRFQIDSRYKRNNWLKSELILLEAEIILEIGAQLVAPLNNTIKNVEIEDSHVIKLILPSQNLESIPETIDQFSKLKVLNLQSNQLTSLPDSIGKLKNLETLDLDHNAISELPESIGNLTKLKYLWLRNNNLKTIPETIISLLQLKHLSWDGNYEVKISKKVQQFHEKISSHDPLVQFYSLPYAGTDSNEYLLKICVLGTPHDFRKAFSRRFVERKFIPNYLPTLGVDITTKKIQVDNQLVKLILVDTAFQEFFGKLRPSYYRGASAAIIVFDKGSRDSFDMIKDWIKEFRKSVPDKLVPIALVGFKTEDDEITSEDGQNLASKLEIDYSELNRDLTKVPTSEIEEIFRNVVRRALKAKTEELSS